MPYVANLETAAYVTYSYDNDLSVTKIDYPNGKSIVSANSGYTFTSEERVNGNVVRTGSVVKDELGQTISKTVQGLTTTYSYDNGGRVTQINSPEGGVTSFVYDFAGRKISQTDKNSGTYTYQYDLVGNLISQTDANGNTITMEYEMVYPDGTAINNIYAPSGHLNQITMDARDGSITGSPVVTYELDLTGGKNQIVRTTGNEVKTNINFDRITNRVLDYQTTTKSGLLADNQVFTYDDRGNISKIEDMQAGTLTMNYIYDAFDRLISSQRGSDTAVNYQYSPSGNLLQKGNITYTYNAGSQPNAVKTAAVDNGTFTNTYYYTYDANGNMVRRNGADAASGDKMTYDSENRLTKIEDDSGNVISNYVYDQGGQRSKKVLKDGSIVYEFGGIYEIAIPNGKPQQQTIYIRGLQGEIVAQMTDPAATLVTANDLKDNERYALSSISSNDNVSSSLSRTTSGKGFSLFVVLDSARTDIKAVIEALEMTTNGISLTSSLKHFINRHVVLNSKLLFQDHASLAYILGGNRLSDKTRITVLLLFVMMLFYFAVKSPLPPFTKGGRGILETNRYNPFITFSTPLVLTIFLLTFASGGCIGLTKHASQTPWGALGIGAINNDTPTIGLGGADTGSSTGTGSGSGLLHKKWTLNLGCLFILYSKIDWACKA